MAKIILHEKALAHLSRGLYRSPASALRELVSNAWDADATYVRIDMNYPNFFQIVVEDNGEGFSKSEFKKLMEGGIGNSTKRPMKKIAKFGRPIIGRLGIGMLGIAQICGAFTISSKPRRGEAFRARVRLYDLLKSRLDSDDKLVVRRREEEVDVGEYDFEDFDPSDMSYGTVLMADDVHPTFIHSFQQSLKYPDYPKYKPPAPDWLANIKFISKIRSLQELGDYWRLLWELSAACPVPYLNKSALPDRLIEKDHQTLESFNFKVIVDNINLKKPVYLRGNPSGYTTKIINEEKIKVYGRDLGFHGYILVQDGVQLCPDELRGIIIRIKNVGIGSYDPSMLDYRINEGPRSRWLTGEIFVDEGLEDALNIDRDSFNRFHPEFRALQEYIHNILQKDIFPRVYKQIDVRSDEKAKSKKAERSKHLKQVIARTTTTPIIIKSKPSVFKPKVEIKEGSDKIEVDMPNSELLKTKKAYRDLAGAILAIFEIAMREDKYEKRKETFTNLLIELLAKW